MIAPNTLIIPPWEQLEVVEVKLVSQKVVRPSTLSLPFNATHAFKSYSISCTSSKMRIEEKGADGQISLLQ